jgi:hypothetical protein
VIKGALAVILLFVFLGTLYFNYLGIRSDIGSALKSLPNPAGIFNGFSSLFNGERIVNANWVHEFFGNVSATREAQGYPAYAESQDLDSFAQQRFKTMTAGNNWQISHYGATGETAEEVLFPDGFLPSDYWKNLNSTAPLHYELLISGGSSYGYYLGQAPSYQVDSGCSTTEIPGPNINVSQFFEQHGCSFTISDSTWFVIDFL